MRKKWDDINELFVLVSVDDTLASCGDNLRLVTYAPNKGYTAWIFKYKGTPVCLFDMGNGHWSFGSPASWIDILIAKFHCRFAEGLRSGM